MAPKPWTEEEEIALCTAWKTVKENPPRRGSIWPLVLNEFKILVGGSTRSTESLNRKWTDLQNKCRLFEGFYQTAVRELPQGTADHEKVEHAKIEHEFSGRPPFGHLSAWQMIRDVPGALD